MTGHPAPLAERMSPKNVEMGLNYILTVVRIKMSYRKQALKGSYLPKRKGEVMKHPVIMLLESTANIIGLFHMLEDLGFLFLFYTGTY